jgi:hypothetical protein
MPLHVLGTGAQDYIAIPMSFAPNGTDQPAATSHKGYIKTALRSDTGLFQLTMPSGFPDIVNVQLTPSFNTKGGAGTTGLKWELGDVSASAGTIDLRLMNDGTTTLVDLAAHANNRLNLTVFVSASSYTK